MSTPPEHMTPVPVELTAAAIASIGQAASGPRRRRSRRVVYRTVVLTADDPTQEILPASSSRVCAYLQALDNDVMLGPDDATVRAKGNTAAAPQLNPSGATLPKANTAPWPIEDSRAVWAGVTTTATNSRVSITAVYED